MRCLNESVRANTLHGLVVDSVGLALHIFISNHGRQQLLITILCKLSLERTQRVVLGIECGFHLQFVVDKQLYIVLHALFIDYTVRIILIVRILKFRPMDWISVDSHYHRIVGLCYSAD